MKMFSNARFENTKNENVDLVAKFLETGEIAKCPPGNLRGNESSRSTRKLVNTLRRKHFKQEKIDAHNEKVNRVMEALRK